MKLSLIISLDSSVRLAIYSFERLPIDIYNFRIEYQSSVPYRTIPEAEEEEDDDKLLFWESNSIQFFLTIELKNSISYGLIRMVLSHRFS